LEIQNLPNLLKNPIIGQLLAKIIAAVPQWRERHDCGNLD
jgi:hypothetical protein